MSQLKYYICDYKRAVGKHWYRCLYLWISPTIIGVFFFRLDRGLYLIFKKYYPVIRILFKPLFYLVAVISKLDLHYKADIGPGLLILHSSLGVVISGNSKIGRNLTLIGGNCIGLKKPGSIIIGNNFTLGVNATVIGPLNIGDNVTIGASSCVVKSLPTQSIYSGVPELFCKNWDLKKNEDEII